MKLNTLKALGLILSLLLNSCGDAVPTFSLLPEEDVFIQNSTFNNKVDILFVVDDQPSMSSFQDELVQSFDTFMGLFVNKGFDFKIAVVTTSGYLADPTLNGYDPANVAEADFNDFDGINHSGMPILTPLDPNLFANFAINAKPDKNTAGQDVRAFSSFRHALQTNRPINQGFLRSDSFLAIVIVDNQDDFSGNERCSGCNVNQRYNAPTLDAVDDYVTFLDGLTGTSGASARYSVSAMTQIGTPCQGSSTMIRIEELVEKTNGTIGDICQADFGAPLADMSNQIATLSTQFYLDRDPQIETIKVYVNGGLVAEGETNGWTYNAEANAIAFHGSAIPAQGDTVFVDYTPTTVK